MSLDFRSHMPPRHRVSRARTCWMCNPTINRYQSPKLCGPCGEVIAATVETFWLPPTGCPGRPYVRRFAWTKYGNAGGRDRGRTLS